MSGERGYIVYISYYIIWTDNLFNLLASPRSIHAPVESRTDVAGQRGSGSSGQNLHAPGNGRTTTHKGLVGTFDIPERMPPIRRRNFIVRERKWIGT